MSKVSVMYQLLRVGSVKVLTGFLLLLVLALFSTGGAIAQQVSVQRTVISGGVMGGDVRSSLKSDTVEMDSLSKVLYQLNQRRAKSDSLKNVKEPRERLFSDSVSLSAMCWTAALLPGYGQIYNKEYWKLPIFYGTMAAGIALYTNENKTYKPLKSKYDELILDGLYRTEELNEVQNDMIRSNTRRQLYLGATLASYIYFLGDAAINYSTNDTSNIKRATTLATICPGAGQIYNKSYWKLPFVVGGFAAMIYVVDWNNRGYKRFKNAYNILIDYENNPDNYPNGSPDEFNGRYTADYMKNLRNSYRRNRDLSIIALAGLYVLQIVDAHVDAHFQDYDISDDISMDIEPLLGTSYSRSSQNNCVTYGFNLNVNF